MGGSLINPAVLASVGNTVGSDMDGITGQAGTSSNAGTNALEASHMARQVVTDIMSQVVPFQGDMSQIVQNRPQVIMPQPTLQKPAQGMDPQQGKVPNPETAYGRQRNDIMDIFHSVGGIVTGAVNQKREKDNNQMMADLAIIQAAASNPSDPHNHAILDKMRQDPKTVKRLQKALGYNPLSGEPMPPETKTMVQFGAQQKQKQDRAQQLAQAAQQRTGSPQGGGAIDALLSRAPNTAQVNPVVQIQGELIKAGIMPKADTSLTAFMTLTKELMTSQEKYDEFKAKTEASNNRTLMMYQKSIDEGRNKLELERIKQAGGKERSQIRAGAEVKSAGIRAAATVKAAEIRQKNSAKLAEMRSKHSLLKTETAELDKDIKNAQVDRAALLQGGKKSGSPEIKTADQKIERLNLLKRKNEELMKMYDDNEGQLQQSLKTPTDELLNDSSSANEDEMDKEDRIF